MIGIRTAVKLPSRAVQITSQTFIDVAGWGPFTVVTARCRNGSIWQCTRPVSSLAQAPQTSWYEIEPAAPRFQRLRTFFRKLYRSADYVDGITTLSYTNATD